MKVVVLDDDKCLVEALQLILMEEGFEVRTACKEAQFWRVMGDFLPEVVVMDYWLIEGNGCEIIKKLKKDRKTAGVRVIMISASNNVEKEALESGAEMFIGKPFAIGKLLAAVTQG